ncbi:hypothetical protein QR680_011896 [Steinernema hermaphroditum]|uniref:DNA2/NAM7 helicase-like C-terminal domain-containing protein n=1 Tax=Steinernema hermaphroditum TaxID=289476 RepID=A0AA39LZJ1_9BILA|nr:hypothetical protein QR680_011896 [Steinernema hermaphroditum]
MASPEVITENDDSGNKRKHVKAVTSSVGPPPRLRTGRNRVREVPHLFPRYQLSQVPLMSAEQTLRPNELKMLSTLHDFTRRTEAIVDDREDALFEELLTPKGQAPTCEEALPPTPSGSEGSANEPPGSTREKCRDGHRSQELLAFVQEALAGEPEVVAMTHPDEANVEILVLKNDTECLNSLRLRVPECRRVEDLLLIQSISYEKTAAHNDTESKDWYQQIRLAQDIKKANLSHDEVEMVDDYVKERRELGKRGIQEKEALHRNGKNQAPDCHRTLPVPQHLGTTPDTEKTTRVSKTSCYDKQRESFHPEDDFALSDERAIVSMTRARSGLVVIGNLHRLKKANSWRTFLDATKDVPVLTSKYVELLDEGYISEVTLKKHQQEFYQELAQVRGFPVTFGWNAQDQRIFERMTPDAVIRPATEPSYDWDDDASWWPERLEEARRRFRRQEVPDPSPPRQRRFARHAEDRRKFIPEAAKEVHDRQPTPGGRPRSAVSTSTTSNNPVAPTVVPKPVTLIISNNPVAPNIPTNSVSSTASSNEPTPFTAVGSPLDFAPGAPLDFAPGAPDDFTPGAPFDFAPGAPLDFAQGAPDDFTPGAPNDFAPGAPIALTSRRPLHVPVLGLRGVLLGSGRERIQRNTFQKVARNSPDQPVDLIIRRTPKSHYVRFIEGQLELDLKIVDRFKSDPCLEYLEFNVTCIRMPCQHWPTLLQCAGRRTFPSLFMAATYVSLQMASLMGRRRKSNSGLGKPNGVELRGGRLCMALVVRWSDNEFIYLCASVVPPCGKRLFYDIEHPITSQSTKLRHTERTSPYRLVYCLFLEQPGPLLPTKPPKGKTRAPPFPGFLCACA